MAIFQGYDVARQRTIVIETRERDLASLSRALFGEIGASLQTIEPFAVAHLVYHLANGTQVE